MLLGQGGMQMAWEADGISGEDPVTNHTTSYEGVSTVSKEWTPGSMHS